MAFRTAGLHLGSEPPTSCDRLSDLSSLPTESAPPLYGRFAVRLRGLVVDAAILAGFAVTVVIVVDAVESETVSGILIPLMVATLLLYDPLMVSAFGATLGHRSVNVRVVDIRTRRCVGVFRALLRSILKTLVGVFSFFFMAITRRHQALHDLAAGTVVIIHDRDRVRAHEYALEADFDEPPRTISAFRRVAAIAAYSVGLFVANSVVLALLLSQSCNLDDVCSSAEETIVNVSSLLAVLATGLLIVFGWRGKLPGARATGSTVTRQPTQNQLEQE